MKMFKKILAVGCAAVCAVSAATPAFAAGGEKPYAEPSADSPSAWYLYGDVDMNGKVTSADARQLLRYAAYMDLAPDESSRSYAAGDFDRDGILSSRDARLVLRRAAGLDAAPEQTPHPYAGKTSVSKEEALALLKNADYVKMTPFGDEVKSYTYTEREKMSADIKASDLITEAALKSQMDTPSEDETKEGTLAYYSYDDSGNITGRTYMYFSKLGPLRNNGYPVYDGVFNFSADDTDLITANDVASASFQYDANNATYTVRVTFKNTRVTDDNATDSVVRRRAISQIHSPAYAAELKSQLNLSGSDSDTLNAVRDSVTFRRNTYNFGIDVKNAYVEYTFSALTELPLSANYGVEQVTTVPGQVLLAQFAMIVNESYTAHFDFHTAQG